MAWAFMGKILKIRRDIAARLSSTGSTFPNYSLICTLHFSGFLPAFKNEVASIINSTKFLNWHNPNCCAQMVRGHLCSISGLSSTRFVGNQRGVNIEQCIFYLCWLLFLGVNTNLGGWLNPPNPRQIEHWVYLSNLSFSVRVFLQTFKLVHAILLLEKVGL